MEQIALADLPRVLRTELGVSPSFASELMRGVKRPSLDLAVKIETATGIPPGFWIDRPDLSHEEDIKGTLNAAPVSGAAHD